MQLYKKKFSSIWFIYIYIHDSLWPSFINSLHYARLQLHASELPCFLVYAVNCKAESVAWRMEEAHLSANCHEAVVKFEKVGRNPEARMLNLKVKAASQCCHHFSKGATLTFISGSGFYDTLHTGAIAGEVASKRRQADMLHANLSMFMWLEPDQSISSTINIQQPLTNWCGDTYFL